MITQARVLELISGILEERNIFIVSLEISNTNKIRLLVDTMQGIPLEDCIKLSRAIENGIDREKEDFELEVSSPGLSAPFKVKEQYLKNVGKQLEVILKGGEKFQGKLAEAGENTFLIEVIETVKTEGKKKKQQIKQSIELAYDIVSKAKVNITF